MTVLQTGRWGERDRRWGHSAKVGRSHHWHSRSTPSWSDARRFARHVLELSVWRGHGRLWCSTPKRPQNLAWESGAAGVSHDIPRAQTCTFEGPGLQKHHQNSTKGPPREGEKNENCGGKNWPKSVWPNSVNTPLVKTGLAKVGQLRLAKVGQIFLAKVGFGQSRSQPFDGISAFDLISRKSMLEGLCRIPGGEQVLPFVRMFYGSPSVHLWEDDSGVVHHIRQGEGGDQGTL